MLPSIVFAEPEITKETIAAIQAILHPDCPYIEDEEKNSECVKQSVDKIFSDNTTNPEMVIILGKNIIGKRGYPFLRSLKNHLSNRKVNFYMKFPKCGFKIFKGYTCEGYKYMVSIYDRVEEKNFPVDENSAYVIDTMRRTWTVSVKNLGLEKTFEEPERLIDPKMVKKTIDGELDAETRLKIIEKYAEIQKNIARDMAQWIEKEENAKKKRAEQQALSSGKGSNIQ